MLDLEKEILRILDDPNTERNNLSLKDRFFESEAINEVNEISKTEIEKEENNNKGK